MSGVEWEAPGWRYLEMPRISDPAQYADPDVDDSSWAVGQAAFGFIQTGIAPFPVPTTRWNLQTSIWLRRHFSTDEVVASADVDIRVRAEQEAWVYWDGVFVGYGSPGGGEMGPFTVPAELVTDTSVLAIYVRDDDVPESVNGQSYADVQVIQDAVSVVRQWPRDDAYGLGSAPRLFPEPRYGRMVGGQE